MSAPAILIAAGMLFLAALAAIFLREAMVARVQAIRLANELERQRARNSARTAKGNRTRAAQRRAQIQAKVAELRAGLEQHRQAQAD